LLDSREQQKACRHDGEQAQSNQSETGLITHHGLIDLASESTT
jgi:hypothetical protein